MIHDPNLSGMLQNWTISVHRVPTMKAPVAQHLRLLVGTMTTRESDVDDPTLRVRTIVTAGAPMLTRASTNPNADGRTVQPRVSRTPRECESGT
jgi:hypothetical protein